MGAIFEQILKRLFSAKIWNFQTMSATVNRRSTYLEMSYDHQIDLKNPWPEHNALLGSKFMEELDGFHQKIGSFAFKDGHS